MPTDPIAQAEAQLRRIEEALGKTASDVADEVGRQGIERHSEVVAFLKAIHGLTHGNANLLAHVVRERLAGGPQASEDLLATQYSGHQSGAAPGLPSACGSCRELGARCDESGPENRRELPQEEAVCAYPSALSKALTAGTEPRRNT